MPLTGIRDMSVIQPPPEDRLSIRTAIVPFDKEVVREAIRRELSRGGQVFFVNDTVRGIPAMERRLRALVPEARLGVAHGQMVGRDLAKVMLAFLDHEIDLLLCTVLIESGLAFPKANTILINRADRFGLAQLYQLRGRVGRSKHRAFAYLLVPGGSVLTREAKKRLEAFAEFGELGSGFRLAMRDLEIRGAGNLLGPSQSGHVAAVGLELYMQLMDQAVRELKGEEMAPEIDPEIKLPVPAYIPEGYIPDVHERLAFYKRVASRASEEEIADLAEEMADRCGNIPPSVANLFELVSLKNFLKALFITSLDYDGDRIFLTFHEGAESMREKVLTLIGENPERFAFSPDLRLSIAFPARDWRDVATEVRKVLH
jgi:transcription-repair coupling factor (superfamily II helicase)